MMPRPEVRSTTQASQARPLRAYCLDWHVTRSDAFAELLVRSLRPFAEIQLTPFDGDVPIGEEPLIFCQVLPPAELLVNPRTQVVWIPMLDHIRRYPPSLWATLPKRLRVVAFSAEVAALAQRAGLPTLRLSYFSNPDEYTTARWDRGRVLYYWNRVGLIHPRLLARICALLKVDRLLFRGELDPHVPASAGYSLPNRLGRTRVEKIPTTLTRAEHLSRIAEANIVIAPRGVEGVGLAYLEALARGCAVLALDAPTMNEYITHLEDGFLLRPAAQSLLRRLHWAARWRLARRLGQPGFHFARRMDTASNWRELAAVDLEQLGHKARERHSAGYARWQAQIPRLARFVLSWEAEP